MIEAVEIAWLRGIKSAQIEGFSAISVLVGPSGCGKSTVLDAIYILTAPSPGNALGHVVKRRSELLNGVRWLRWRGDRAGPKTPLISVLSTGTRIEGTLGIGAQPDLPNGLGDTEAHPGLERRTGFPAIDRVHLSRGFGTWSVYFNRRNDWAAHQEGFGGSSGNTRLVLPSPGASHAPLPDVYAEAFLAGRIDDVIAILSDVIPGLKTIANITPHSGEGDLALSFGDHAIPAGSCGDGEQALLRLCLELGGPAGSTVLVEDPEAHLHPAALRQSARAIAAAARHGIQVILTTHSLELIDDLVAELGPNDVDLLTVFSLVRRDGDVSASRHAGKSVATVREAVGKDYR